MSLGGLGLGLGLGLGRASWGLGGGRSSSPWRCQLMLFAWE